MERIVKKSLIVVFIVSMFSLSFQYFSYQVDSWKVRSIARELEYEELHRNYVNVTSNDGYEVPNREYLLFPFVADAGVYVTSQFHLRTNPFEDNSGPVVEDKMHHGLDVTVSPYMKAVATKQDVVRATVSGTVVEHFPPPNRYWKGDGPRGGKVVIEDSSGVRHSFSHLSETFVSSREGKNVVEAGDPIGRMGDTGLTTGPHLHYEIYVADSEGKPLTWYDPIYYFDIRVDPKTGEVMFPVGEEDVLTLSY